MASVTAPCLECKTPLNLDTASWMGAEQRCPQCGTVQVQYVYPDAATARDTAPSTPLHDADGASCYFHTTAAAVSVCDDCGRYLCSLCTLPVPMPANSPPN